MTAPAEGSLAVLAADAVRRHREGDSAAMSELVRRATPLLWHLARSQGLDQTAAEDVVQTTWLRLVQHADALTEPAGVLKWLMTTARREAWAVARTRRHDTPEDTATWHDRPTDDPSPDDVALGADTDARLWRHVRELPERCQQLLRVIAFADRPDYAAVSEALGMPVGSIGPTRGRCLAKLRQLLAADPAWEVTA